MFVFASIQSNSFDVKKRWFLFPKNMNLWTADFNIKQGSVQQSTISAHKLSYEFIRIVNIFREKFSCLRLVIAVVGIDMETLKEWNSVVTICSKCCRNRFLKNIAGWDYLLGIWLKIKFPEICRYFYMTVFP